MTPEETAHAPRRLGVGRVALCLAGAWAISLSVYAGSLQGELVFDDQPLLVATDCYRSLARIPALFDLRSGDICTLRPLRFVSYALDYAVFGGRVTGYHLTNVLLHGLVGWLALLLLLRLGLGLRLGLLGAGLFLLHPIATEAVAYVSGRRDLLMALFGLLTALALLGYSERGGLGRLALALLALLAALLSHESAAALPAALAVLELCRRTAALPAERRGSVWALGRSLLDFFWRTPSGRRAAVGLVCGVALALAFSLWTVTLHNFSYRSGLWGGSLGAHVGTVLRVHTHYLKQLAWPLGLNADYSYDAFAISRSLSESRVLLAALVLAGLLGGALAVLRRAPLVSGAALAYFTLLLPASQIVVHHELLAEHRLYLPALCFCGPLAAGLLALTRRTRWAYGLAAAILAAYGGLTIQRSLDWTSAERLWSATLRTAPRCARAHQNLGTALALQRRYPEARRSLEQALEIQPGLCLARLNLGQLLLDMGEGELGLTELRRAASCRRSAQGYSVLGLGALRLGRLAEAEAAFREGLALEQRDPQLRYGLGRVLQRRGELSGALEQFQLAERARGAWPALLLQEGRTLVALGRRPDAARVLDRLVQLAGEGSPEAMALRRVLAGPDSGPVPRARGNHRGESAAEPPRP